MNNETYSNPVPNLLFFPASPLPGVASPVRPQPGENFFRVLVNPPLKALPASFVKIFPNPWKYYTTRCRLLIMNSGTGYYLTDRYRQSKRNLPSFGMYFSKCISDV